MRDLAAALGPDGTAAGPGLPADADTTSVALYALDEYLRFGRLMACSRPVRTVLAKSQDLSGWRACMGEVAAGRVWRNTALVPGLPSYACGSFHDGRLQMMVCVWRAEPDQLDMRFANLVKVMCGLLEVSFSRAQDYAELARAWLCFPGTEVMRAEPFAQAVQAQREMRDKGVADYVLLSFPGLTPGEAQARLIPHLRATDDLGVGQDGSVQALLRQAGPETAGAVCARLEAAGLTPELAEG